MMHTRFGPGTTPRGFTLVEVLVAFVIAGLAMGALFRGGADGLLSARVAGRMEEAVARAQSRLVASCHGTRLRAGTVTGDDGGGFGFRTQVLNAGGAIVARGNEDEPKPALRATLFAVRVTMSWGGAASPREVSLATSCLALATVEPA